MGMLAVLSTVITEDQGSTRASIVLWIAAGLVVVLGMARLPLMPDRLWRFICWSVAIVLALYAASRIEVVPSGWIWITWAFLAIVVLGLLFWIEMLLERNKTEAVKEAGSAAMPSRAAAPMQTPSSPVAAPPPLSREPLFDEAPPGLADLSAASLAELFASRTGAQADKLMEEHIGKTVTISGEVDRVGLSNIPHVAFKEAGDTAGVLLFFDAEGYDAEPVLLALNQGDTITASGRIYRIRGNSLTLDRCKLIDARAAVSP